MPLAKWLKRHKLLMMLVELVVERSSLERIIFKARSEWITELPGSAMRSNKLLLLVRSFETQTETQKYWNCSCGSKQQDLKVCTRRRAGHVSQDFINRKADFFATDGDTVDRSTRGKKFRRLKIVTRSAAVDKRSLQKMHFRWFCVARKSFRTYVQILFFIFCCCCVDNKGFWGVCGLCVGVCERVRLCGVCV